MLLIQEEEQKEISVEQKLQVSIPLPENSKYLVNKTVIFGEGSKFSGILYLQHDETADDTVSFYRKNMISDGWSEIGIVRSRFILINYQKENRFATIKVILVFGGMLRTKPIQQRKTKFQSQQCILSNS